MSEMNADKLADALRAFPEDPNPYTYRMAYAKARAALAEYDAQPAQAAQPVGVPDGWVMVPIGDEHWPPMNVIRAMLDCQDADPADGSESEAYYGLRAALLEWKRQQPPAQPSADAELVEQLRGRAAYLRDLGRIKSPQLMERAATALAAGVGNPMTTEMDALPESVQRMVNRLNELSDAVAQRNWGEFSMHVPTNPNRDADLVLADVAVKLIRLTARVQELERENGRLIDCNSVLGSACDTDFERAERAEAELASLKKRITDAPVQVRPCEPTPDGIVGKRYALLPLDDEAKS